MTLQLSFEENPLPNDIQILGNGIMAYAREKKGFKPLDFFAFFIRDKDNTIVGGCNGSTLYGCLYIDQLWVSDSIRNQGWGKKLMNAALDYGKEKGCTFATVNTMDWEAIGFYHKLGFKLEFERRGFQKNSVFYFLRKEFFESDPSIQKQSPIKISTFAEKDITHLVNEFARHHWPKPKSTFESYWHEQMRDERLIWLAFYNEQLAGYVTLKWVSYYQPFRENHIPEIMDLNVLPPYRNKGIGSRLLNTAEREAALRSDVVGLGVGLYQDYGNAQKLYIKKGYSPDGHGVTYQYKAVKPGNSAPVDDDLVLWFTKKLKSPTQQGQFP
ncbi:N-acetyltransferase GCN5 [Legionella lansingensis]|uniref:N-acetyltransferase domain-containing protein n=1 Tax=Legionella lansingensis TaxID=45067 RepID=A0A0W0VY41_9GAMM|nr:GNAT family N-acetyltransferase [Legionella lansingensis]KTD24975.1 hypothetical protein Llan_0280 [Legionella lansingensis]SNV48245.1 N-acetyltransferase GCN5 [Legionella lansingensis]